MAKKEDREFSVKLLFEKNIQSFMLCDEKLLEKYIKELIYSNRRKDSKKVLFLFEFMDESKSKELFREVIKYLCSFFSSDNISQKISSKYFQSYGDSFENLISTFKYLKQFFENEIRSANSKKEQIIFQRCIDNCKSLVESWEKKTQEVNAELGIEEK